MSEFVIDERLARDSDPVVQIGVSELRLMKDRRWPWLVLVPQRADISELFELTSLDQTMLALEINMVAASLKRATGATKINVGALGNIVRQLHIHIIGRSVDDPNWPGPVWGYGQAEPYSEAEKQTFIRKILEALSS